MGARPTIRTAAGLEQKVNSSVIDMSRTSERKEVAPTSDATALMQLIDRAARDPNCDIERMERLLAMHERLLAMQAKVAYMAALARLQPKLPIIKERGEILNKVGAVQSRYALWEDIVGTITPLLASEGFALSFRIGNLEQRIQVTGVLTHSGGHSEQTPIDLPADTSGSKNAVQAVASSVSYGKRYTAGALLNLRMGELDDDGQSAGKVLTLSDEQVAQVERRLKEANVDRKGFLEFWQVEDVWHIPACNFALIMQRLDKAAKNITPRPDLSNVDESLRDKRVSEIADLVAEYGSDDSEEGKQKLAGMLQDYHATYLQPFPELFIAVNDKLAKDGLLSKANFKKLLSLVLKS
jgi:ERF superfamily